MKTIKIEMSDYDYLLLLELETHSFIKRKQIFVNALYEQKFKLINGNKDMPVIRTGTIKEHIEIALSQLRFK